MFAIVSISGKQYTVEKGDTISVDKIEGNAGETVKFNTVLLTDNKGKIVIGTPNVKNAAVTAKIVSQDKGEKITVRRYKNKVRHRRQIGFRPSLTKLEIVDVA